MPEKKVIYKVFIASPSDVKDEVKVLFETIYHWNTVNSEMYEVFLHPVNWRTDSFPEMGNEPQKIINNQIVDKADVLIGVFWSRIGTPTKDAQSGTVEEINSFIANGKPTLLYFSSRTIDPYSIDQQQFTKVKEIKERYKSEGIIWEFSDIYEFTLIIFCTTNKIAKPYGYELSELDKYGNITHFSDMVGFLEKHENDNALLYKISIKKNCFGKQDVIYLKYDPDCLRFKDYIVNTEGW
jgi:hypothetical protein